MQQEAKLKALGAYIFAGGFSIGVEQHFDVLAHLENGTYGVATYRLNRPATPVHTSPASWPIEEYSKVGVDFVFANPPCALFSSAGASILNGIDNWKTDPRQSCIHECFGLLEKFKPTVLVIESVVNAFTRGRELFDTLAAQAHEQGYSVTHVLENACWLGVPQVRKRYFFVAHKKTLTLHAPNWAPPPTVNEILATVKDPGYTRPVKPGLVKYYEGLNQQNGANKGIRSMWEKDNPVETHIMGPSGVMGRPRMMEHRIPYDTPMGAYIGDFCIHPTEPRNLGLEEAKALCCFPADWKFACTPQHAFSELARGVMPPVGEWLARGARDTILYGSPESGNTYIVDYRDAPAPMGESL